MASKGDDPKKPKEEIKSSPDGDQSKNPPSTPSREEVFEAARIKQQKEDLERSTQAAKGKAKSGQAIRMAQSSLTAERDTLKKEIEVIKKEAAKLSEELNGIRQQVVTEESKLNKIRSNQMEIAELEKQNQELQVSTVEEPSAPKAEANRASLLDAIKKGVGLKKTVVENKAENKKTVSKADVQEQMAAVLQKNKDKKREDISVSDKPTLSLEETLKNEIEGYQKAIPLAKSSVEKNIEQVRIFRAKAEVLKKPDIQTKIKNTLSAQEKMIKQLSDQKGQLEKLRQEEKKAKTEAKRLSEEKAAAERAAMPPPSVAPVDPNVPMPPSAPGMPGDIPMPPGIPGMGDNVPPPPPGPPGPPGIPSAPDAPMAPPPPNIPDVPMAPPPPSVPDAPGIPDAPPPLFSVGKAEKGAGPDKPAPAPQVAPSAPPQKMDVDALKMAVSLREQQKYLINLEQAIQDPKNTHLLDGIEPSAKPQILKSLQESMIPVKNNKLMKQEHYDQFQQDISKMKSSVGVGDKNFAALNRNYKQLLKEEEEQRVAAEKEKLRIQSELETAKQAKIFAARKELVDKTYGDKVVPKQPELDKFSEAYLKQIISVKGTDFSAGIAELQKAVSDQIDKNNLLKESLGIPVPAPSTPSPKVNVSQAEASVVPVAPELGIASALPSVPVAEKSPKPVEASVEYPPPPLPPPPPEDDVSPAVVERPKAPASIPYRPPVKPEFKQEPGAPGQKEAEKGFFAQIWDNIKAFLVSVKNRIFGDEQNKVAEQPKPPVLDQPPSVPDDKLREQEAINLAKNKQRDMLKSKKVISASGSDLSYVKPEKPQTPDESTKPSDSPRPDR